MLYAAPIAAIAATLLLMVATEQIPQVLAWGGLIALVAAVPIVVPGRCRRAAVWVCAALVLGAIALSVLSIGAYFAPAFVALVIAGCTRRPDRP